MADRRFAVIFDLDGTLWDTTGCSCDIWNRVFDRHEPDAVIRSITDLPAMCSGFA